jgi:hypothetical protein
MSWTKRALEELSTEIGEGGIISERVLAYAERDPSRFAEAGRRVRERVGDRLVRTDLPAGHSPGPRPGTRAYRELTCSIDFASVDPETGDRRHPATASDLDWYAAHAAG